MTTVNHPLHEHLTRRLVEQLRKRRVVVWYDPDGELAPYLDELATASPGTADQLPQVLVGQTATRLARFEGSYFALRLQVEPYVSGHQPNPLLIYVAASKPESKDSVLLELEKAGCTYEPQLKRVARAALSSKYGDGEIDKLLAPEGLSYADVVQLLTQGDSGGSLLKLVFPAESGQPLAMLAAWLANPSSDPIIEAKQAKGELRALVEARLGLTLSADGQLAAARTGTLRYVLVNEFRSDLGCAAPPQVALVPSAPSAEHLQRIRDLAARLRHDHAHAYTAMADQVQDELNLAKAGLDPAALGSLDTFRFEEEALLGLVGGHIVDRRYADALTVINERGHSFWLSLQNAEQASRAAQWQACRLMADLGLAIKSISPALAKMPERPEAWVQTYTAADGWHRADMLYRNLEALVATMDEGPAAERALGAVRAEYETLLSRMAEGFTKALCAGEWAVPGVLHQTRTFAEIVEPGGSPVAFFLVDSLRYEMGAELQSQLSEAQDQVLRPAVAALPSVTQVGMAALLPGASTDFSVVAANGKLAARIGDTVLANWNDRRKYLAAVQPSMVEMTLDKVVQSSPSKLKALLGNAPLILVRSTEIDTLGETGNELLARQFVNTVIGNVARAVRSLAKAGIARFVITADHGHQLAARKEGDMTMDSPGTDGIKASRRCWAGQGGKTPPAAVRVTGAELGYDTPLDFIFPTGTGIFSASGGQSYHHGGASLQELVVPVLSLRMPTAKAESDGGAMVTLSDCPETVTNRIFSAKILFTPNLLNQEPLPVRVVLLADGKQIGLAKMAIDAACDPATGTVILQPGTTAAVGLQLAEDTKVVQVVVQDPATDAVLAQSQPLPIKLGY